jgi:hypothetical protein
VAERAAGLPGQHLARCLFAFVGSADLDPKCQI